MSHLQPLIGVKSTSANSNLLNCWRIPTWIQCVNLGTVKIVSDSQQHIIKWLYKDGQHVSSLKVNPKHLNHPQVAGCSIGHNPSPFNFSESTPQILPFYILFITLTCVQVFSLICYLIKNKAAWDHDWQLSLSCCQVYGRELNLLPDQYYEDSGAKITSPAQNEGWLSKVQHSHLWTCILPLENCVFYC